MTTETSRIAAARRKEKAMAKRVTEGLKILEQGLHDPPVKRSYMTKLKNDIRAAKKPTVTARAIVKDLREVHAKPALSREALLASIDLSGATVARAALLRRQPKWLRSVAAYEAEIQTGIHRVLMGDIDQAAFDKQMIALASKTLPDWMQRTEPTMVELHPRPPCRMMRRPSVPTCALDDPRLDIPKAFRRRPELLTEYQGFSTGPDCGLRPTTQKELVKWNSYITPTNVRPPSGTGARSWSSQRQPTVTRAS